MGPEKVQENLGNLQEGVSEVSAGLEGIPLKAANAFSSIAENVQPALQALDKIVRSNSAVRMSLLGVSEIYKDAFSDFGKRATAGFMPLQDQFAELNKQISTMATGPAISLLEAMIPSSMKAQADAAKNSATSVKAYKDSLTNMIETVVKGSDEHFRLREQVLTTAGQFGSMNILDSVSGKFQNLNEYVSYVDSSLREMGEGLGVLPKDMAKFYDGISKIPGAFQLTFDASQSARAGTDNLMVGLIELNRGTKIPMETLIQGMVKLRDEYNLKTTGEGAKESGQMILETFSNMSKASQNLGISYEDFSSKVTASADKFKLFGNNAIGVTRSIYDMAKGFNEVGLSAKNAAAVSESFINKLSDLGVAQKAFVSELTGGPGGAMGAAQIDLMLKRGQTEEVMKKAREAIKSQLGEIVTTEEAAESQEAAGRRLLQIKQLQALGLGAQGEREAGVQLDLLKAQEMGRGAESLKDSQSLAREFLEKGKKETEETASPIKLIAGHVESMRGDLNRIMNNTTQFLMGGKVPFRADQTIIPGLTSGVDFLSPLRGYMQDARQGSLESARIKTESFTRGGSIFSPELISSSDMLTKGAKATGESMKLLIQKVVESTTTGEQTTKLLDRLKTLESDKTQKGVQQFEFAYNAIKNQGVRSAEDLDKAIKQYMAEIKPTKPAVSGMIPATSGQPMPSTATPARRPAVAARAGSEEGASLVMPVNSGVICAVCHEKLHNLYVRLSRFTSPITP